jgi:hypothetical protein
METLIVKLTTRGAVINRQFRHFFEQKDDLTETVTSHNLLKRLTCNCKSCTFHKNKIIDHINKGYSLGVKTPCSCGRCQHFFHKVVSCSYPNAPVYEGCDNCGCSTHPLPNVNYCCKCKCHAKAYHILNRE